MKGGQKWLIKKAQKSFLQKAIIGRRIFSSLPHALAPLAKLQQRYKKDMDSLANPRL